MIIRTFGWVQNPSDFTKLKITVNIFDNESEHYQNLRDYLVQDRIIYFNDIRDHLQDLLDDDIDVFSYKDLVGVSRDKYGKSPKKRNQAEANSLIQISCLPQNYKTTGRTHTDNWTADGFLRWAVSLNFLEFERETDLFSITDLGKSFSQSIDDSEEEKDILTEALLSYPPASQVLRVLSENPGYRTKFFIGERLGFRGEKGFTSYDESLMMDWLKNSSKREANVIRRDVEGTSDKYARMIAGWLKKLGLVQSKSEKISNGTEKFNNFMGYSITARGEHALRQAQGGSSNRGVTKYLMWEFLATDGPNRDYVRTRRAYILKYLEETRSFSVLLNKLKQKGFHEDEAIISNDIKGLNTFGIRIVQNGNNIELKDRFVDFCIPRLNVTDVMKDQEVEKRKREFMRRTNLDQKYIELLEIAYDGDRNRDFEIVTAELFKKVYNLPTILLGGARKPDVLVFTNKFGVIVDTKAYGEGYSKSITEADKMIRYIEDNQRRDIERNPTEWWTAFDDNIPENQFYFLWISSKFIKKFQEQIDYTASQTSVNGGALNVEQLLLGADAVSKSNLNANDLPHYMNNKEIDFGV